MPQEVWEIKGRDGTIFEVKSDHQPTPEEAQRHIQAYAAAEKAQPKVMVNGQPMDFGTYNQSQAKQQATDLTTMRLPDIVRLRNAGTIDSAALRAELQRRTTARTRADQTVAMDYAPAVGGAVGGIVGGVPGALVGGMVGSRLQQHGEAALGERPLPTTGPALKEMSIEAGKQALGEGAGALLTKGLVGSGRHLMQSALKPSAKAIRAGVQAGETTTPVVQTLLDEGINVSAGGVTKLQSILNATNDQITALVKNAQGTISKKAAVAPVLEVAEKFSNQVDPLADLETIGKTVEAFLNHPTLGRADLTPSQAQAMKVGTYRLLKGKYGKLGAAGVEAEKAVARGLKDEIAAGTPAVTALNAREGRILEALEEVGKRAALNANKDPVGFAWIAHEPAAFLAALIDRNGTVKSMLARGLYDAAAAAGKVSAQAIRIAVASLAAGEPREDIE